MRLRHAEDLRALFWAFVLFPLLPALELAHPRIAPWLLPVGLYLAYSAGVLVHNQVHCPVFAGRRWNAAYAAWLSIFYGFPALSWVPTHNRNHHRHLNGEGDATRTRRLSDRNTLWNALRYPFASSRWQAPLLARFVIEARAKRPRLFREIGTQAVAVAGAHAGLCAACLAAFGAARGLWLYAIAFGIPALFAPWAMMFTNYVQHVDCDPTSPNDHSRNFVDRVANWLLFDSGYHTVHHENAGTHWSRYRALHAARARDIDPVLNEGTIVGYCVKTYLLGPLVGRRQQPTPGRPRRHFQAGHAS